MLQNYLLTLQLSGVSRVSKWHSCIVCTHIHTHTQMHTGVLFVVYFDWMHFLCMYTHAGNDQLCITKRGTFVVCKVFQWVIVYSFCIRVCAYNYTHLMNEFTLCVCIQQCRVCSVNQVERTYESSLKKIFLVINTSWSDADVISGRLCEILCFTINI